MFSLKPSDANDPQGLMRRKEPNKQTNKQVLVQPSKTCPFITEILLMGRKELNQTNYTCNS